MQFITAAADEPRRFWLFVLLAALLKLGFAAALPLTGDEAYFVLYARSPDWGGFYDHPPLVGWLIWLMAHIGSHEFILRLPAVALGLVLPLGVYAVLRPVDVRKARLVALLLLLTPVYLLGVLITTDTGLILFGFLSVLALYRAESHGPLRWYALAGLLLGLAFYSKYFAALLGLAFAVYFLAYARSRWREFLLLFAIAGIFVLLNLFWNYLHCWNHVMFNVVNRHSGGGAPSLGSGVVNLALYGLMLVYLFALPLWFAVRDRARIRAGIGTGPWRVFLVAGLVPLALFLLIAPFRSVGLHWVLGFVPLLYVLYGFLPRASLERSLRFMTVFATLHVLVVVGLLLYPLERLQGHERYADALFYAQPQAVAEALAPLQADHYAIGSYSRAAVLSYYTGESWSVFGTGAAYGREDDRITDWRARDGESVLILARRYPMRSETLEAYFESLEVLELEIHGAPFHVALGQGFRYSAYRGEVLRPVRERFYRIPAWLPMGGCHFLERHFDGVPGGETIAD